MNKEKLKENSKIAVFTSLWAISEVFLGNVLHQFNVPFKGLILTMVPAFLLCISVFFLENKISIFKIGISVALIRSLLSWKFNIFVTLSIFMQGLLVYLSFLIFRKNIMGAIVGGILVELWTFFQGYFFRVVFFGANIDEIINGIKKSGIFEGYYNNIIILFSMICLLHIIPGVLSSIAGYKIGSKVASEN